MIAQLSGVPTPDQVKKFLLIAAVVIGYVVVVVALWVRQLSREKQKRRAAGFEVIEKDGR